MSDDDYAIGQAVDRIEQQGKIRHGEHWQQYIGALQRIGGITPEGAKFLLAQPDPVATVVEAGKEVLLNEADNGNRDSELAYSEARQAEREAYKRLRGRR